MKSGTFISFLPFFFWIFTFSIPIHDSESDPEQKSIWIAPTWADTLHNPYKKAPDWLITGRKLYNNQCVVCHGIIGRGDGDSGFGLEVPPGDLNDAFTQQESDGAIYWKMNTGRGPMPAYQEKFSDEERWLLVAYIREMQREYLTKKALQNHKNRMKK